MITETAERPYSILNRITCPHCWEQFSPEKLLWIAEHAELLGDSRLGPEEPQRFLPTRFTISGEAIDANGFPCRSLACPQCHLEIPRAALEMEPLFLSIFGAPASGKSYFLASMTWELRKLLRSRFALSFSDADPAMNQILNSYEESLFVNADSDRLVPLANLIRKTEEQGDLYDTVSYGSQTVSYPRPFLFSMQPTDEHPNSQQAARLSRMLCLYDNAGESFQPGKDSASNPVTRHMAQSRVLFFVFDPTQDNRFRKKCRGGGFTANDNRTTRQEPILQEAGARIRRYTGLRQNERHKRPLVVILTKCDEWSHLLGEDVPTEPTQPISRNRLNTANAATPRNDIHALDVQLVERRSRLVRTILEQYTPEIVNAAESLSEHVTYVPVSAIGWNVHLDASNGQHSIRPVDTEPHWVTVPFLYALCRWTPGLIPAIKPKKHD